MYRDGDNLGWGSLAEFGVERWNIHLKNEEDTRHIGIYIHVSMCVCVYVYMYVYLCIYRYMGSAH